MSLIKPTNLLSKDEIQALVTSNDPTISFIKPTNIRSECWTNYSQIYHENKPQEYIICLSCKAVLKWISGNGIRVMRHHNCSKNKLVSTTPSRQRIIS